MLDMLFNLVFVTLGLHAGLGVHAFVDMLIYEFTDLDHDFREHIGSVRNNSFIKDLDSDIDENDDLIQLKIINHSPYQNLRNYP